MLHTYSEHTREDYYSQLVWSMITWEGPTWIFLLVRCLAVSREGRDGYQTSNDHSNLLLQLLLRFEIIDEIMNNTIIAA